MGLQIVLLCLFYLYVGRLSNSVGLDSKIFLQPGTVMLASILSLDSFYLDTFAAAGFILLSCYICCCSILSCYICCCRIFILIHFILIHLVLQHFILIHLLLQGFILLHLLLQDFYLDTFGVAGCREAVHRVILKILRCTKRLHPISALHYIL